MTDRVRTLTVVLDRDYRTDDIEVVAQGIRMIKGVAAVENGDVVDHAAHIARNDFRQTIGRAISELAAGSDTEFHNAVRAAYEQLKVRRGF